MEICKYKKPDSPHEVVESATGARAVAALSVSRWICSQAFGMNPPNAATPTLGTRPRKWNYRKIDIGV